MVVALASDHAALGLKERLKQLLDEMGIAYRDYGANDEDLEKLGKANCHYPIFSVRAARAVSEGVCDRGIVVCGTGIGMSLAANKVEGIRCAVCTDPFCAALSRQHNDANMLALGARVTAPEYACEIARVWLTTEFEGGRHQTRVDLISAVEEGRDIE